MHRLDESTREKEVFEALLERPEPAISWGLTFEAGQRHPVQVALVTPGGPADRIGLKHGDEVTEIGDQATAQLTHEEANQLLNQYGLSLILTVERRAGTEHPTTYPTGSHTAPTKAYQTYDMTGLNPVSSHPPAHSQHFEFQQVTSRPYEAPAKPQQYQAAAPPIQHVQAPEPHNAQPIQYNQYSDYAPSNNFSNASQSRTFRLLEGLMSNEEPYAGTSGLPPLRSASMEQWRQEQNERQQQRYHSPRVKVFMPQQYNTPLGMYSMDNVVDSFQSQAEQKLQHLNSDEQNNEFEAQQAAMANHGSIGQTPVVNHGTSEQAPVANHGSEM